MNKKQIKLSVFVITISVLSGCAIYTKESKKMSETDSQQSEEVAGIMFADLVLAVNNQVPGSLKEIFSEENLLSPKKSVINSEQFKKLAKQEQNDLIEVIKKAVIFYQETAYIKPIDLKRIKISKQLEHFLELVKK
jgi:hypothetical protein